tara:strand:+ start:6484 stop:7626 length:1143 start_codon:yes stop_codon:yes gene_type:complete
MAVYKIFPEKDTTLYTEYPSKNTGLDPIIEASTYQSNATAQVSRYLIKFPTSQISEMYTDRITSGEYKTYLKNFNAVVTGLNLDQELEFFPISGNWGMGTGRYNDSPIVTNGSSWDWLDYSGSTEWPSSGFNDYVTASFQSTLPGGGNWYTGSNLALDPISQSQIFTYADTKDVLVDVTNIVETWYSYSLDNTQGFANEGFLVKQPSGSEFVNTKANNTIFKFFSIDTNTIYPPQLEFRFNDYIFNTGSSKNIILPQVESFISIYNNQGTYYSESIPRLRFAAMPKYPDRAFLTASLYTTNYFLPESQSLYAIKDTETNEFVIEFDTEYTRISSDATSSYFDLYCNGLEPERYYTILVKTSIGGQVKVFDENIMFKIAKG